MKRALAAAATASTMLVTAPAHAEWSVGAGFENFEWKESTSPQVKESGLRWALDLTWTQSREPGLSAAVNVKLYNGNVDYNGAGLFTGTPLSGETHYRGVQGEVQAWYRMPNTIDVMLAIGWDRWDRRLSVAQEETWDVMYAKLGVAMNTATKQGFLGSVGVKYPVWTRENANFFELGGATNPRLKPGKSISLYGTLGYRVNPSWDVYAYYESFRFDESPTVAVPLAAGGTAFAFQPESKMDVIGMKVQYNFQ